MNERSPGHPPELRLAAQVLAAALVAVALAGIAAGDDLAWPWMALAAALAGGLVLWLLARRARAAGGRLRALLESLPAGATGEAARSVDDFALAGRVQALVEREREMRLIADTVHGLEALFAPDRRLRWISPSIAAVTGFTPRECLEADDPLALLVHQTDRAYCHKQAGLAFNEFESVSFELRLEHRDGGLIWAACHWTPVRDAAGRLEAVRVSAEPIQARKEAELRLLESVAEMRRARSLSEHYLLRTKDERQRLSAVLDALSPGIVMMDTDQRVLYFNQSFVQMWGFPADENLFGLRDVVLFTRCEAQMADAAAFREHFNGVLQGGQGSAPFEFRLLDGRVIDDSSVVVRREESGIIIGRVWIFEDVTTIRRSAEILQHQAERDALTGLYNRRRFDEELDRAIAESRRRSNSTGLLIFDLDGFKPVNDTYGHQAGDQVLIGLAEAISRVVRRHEMLFRFGGDEFAILVPGSDDSHLKELARRVVECVAETRFVFEAIEVRLTASVGLAVYPHDADDMDGLLAAADAAMYRAKTEGKNRWMGTERSLAEAAAHGIPLESRDPDPDRN